MGKALNIIRIDLRNENGFYIYILDSIETIVKFRDKLSKKN